MKKLLESLKKGFAFLQKHGVIEQMFSSEHPSMSKEYVEAVTKLADEKVDRRFLTDPRSGSVFLRYKIHPLKGISLFCRWLCQAPWRNA